MIKHWTAEEDDVIRTLYPTHSAKEIAKRMGRTTNAVQVRAAKLGLRKREPSPWTEGEIEYLKANYNEIPRDELAANLPNHSISSISAKAKELGVRKTRPPRWTKEDYDTLNELWGEKTIPQIAKRLGRTETAVDVKVKRLKMGTYSQNTPDYLTLMQVSELLGVDYHKITDNWIPRHGLKYKNIRPIGRMVVRYIKISHLLNWLRDNPDLWDSRRLEPHSFGIEPEWLKQKRAEDAQKPETRVKQWSQVEDSILLALKQAGKTWREITVHMNRTKASCAHRYLRLKAKRQEVS